MFSMTAADVRRARDNADCPEPSATHARARSFKWTDSPKRVYCHGINWFSIERSKNSARTAVVFVTVSMQYETVRGASTCQLI